MVPSELITYLNIQSKGKERKEAFTIQDFANENTN
jgi:hypothetical protein